MKLGRVPVTIAIVAVALPALSVIALYAFAYFGFSTVPGTNLPLQTQFDLMIDGRCETQLSVFDLMKNRWSSVGTNRVSRALPVHVTGSDGAPLSGVTVEARYSDAWGRGRTASASSDADGLAQPELDSALGTHDVELAVRGLWVARATRAKADATQVEFQVLRPASLVVQVMGTQATPVEHVTLEVYGDRQTTDRSGEAHFLRLLPNPNQRVIQPRVQGKCIGLRRIAATTVALEEGQQARLVLTAESGAAVVVPKLWAQHVYLKQAGESFEAICSQDLRDYFPDVPAGPTQVVWDGYDRKATREVTVNDNGVLEVEAP